MMKVLWVVFVVFLGESFADDPELQKMQEWSLDEKIDFIQSFPKQDRSPEWQKGIKALSYHLAGNYSMKWQRNFDGLQDLRSQLEELRPLIMTLGYSEDERDRTRAISIGKYLKIDQEVEKMFYHVSEESLGKKGQSKLASLDAIFGYGLESEELKKDLVDGLSIDSETSGRSRFGPVAMGRSGIWKLDEATENLMLLLEQKYEQHGNVQHGALKSLKELGPAATKILSRLKALYEQRKKDGDADFREIEALEFAIARISKKPESLNGKGQSPKRSVIDRNLSSKQAEQVPSGSNDQKSKSLTKWLGVIAGILVLGILALLFKIIKGKSASQSL